MRIMGDGEGILAERFLDEKGVVEGRHDPNLHEQCFCLPQEYVDVDLDITGLYDIALQGQGSPSSPWAGPCQYS